MKIHLSGRQFVFPRQCVCCGDFPAATLSVSGSERNQSKRMRTKGWVWEIPYCAYCKRHVLTAERFQLLFLSLVSLALPVQAAIGLADRTPFGLAVLNLALTLGGLWLCYWLVWRILGDRLPPKCTCLERSMLYLGSDGPRHSFEVKSRFYAKEFVLSNPHKVVDPSTQVTSILQNTRFGKHQMPRRILRA